MTVEPQPSKSISFDLHDRLVEVTPDDEGFSIPSFALHAAIPKGLGGRYAGYVPQAYLKGWHDPVAFLRERRADVSSAPPLFPTELLAREDNPPRYTVGEEARSWNLERWLRPADQADLDVEDFRGRAVCLFFLQTTCPGCRSHGLPAVTEVARHFQCEERVAVVVLQSTSGPRSRSALQKGLDRLTAQLPSEVHVGHCHGVREPAQVLSDYQVGAAPWTVIIDPEGILQFSNLTVRPAEIIRRIEEQLPQPAGPSQATGDDATSP